MLRAHLASAILVAVGVLPLSAQQRDTTSGFAIRDQTVVSRCGTCHVADSAGLLQRLSYLRKTPEGWEMSIRRMVSLYDVPLDTTAARSIVRYLSDNQGLAPEEVRPARFELERRMVDYRYEADEDTETTCRACHSMGRVLLQRRTRPEWELLIATHRGLWPLVDGQSFRRNPPAAQPMDQAVTHLARSFPLRTPEWSAWTATMRPPRLEGTWLLTGKELGKGALSGRMVVTRGTAEGEFITRITYRHAGGGAPVTREGRAIVYTGFQWRGRSTAPGAPANQALREVLLVEPGWQQMSGRWYAGAYDELGVDVTFTRVSGGAQLAAVTPRALRRGASTDVTIFGANLPGSPTAQSLDLGPGIVVERVVRANADSIVARVSVASNAAVGERDVFVAGASLRSGAVVYDQVTRIEVTPPYGLARVGGVVFPKQLQQFEAIGYSDGPDGRPNTDDDLDVGTVPVAWSLEEYGATYDDDDARWVGALSADGRFTPAVDGPNPLRVGNRNNIGDVWVVATHQAGPAPTRPVRARALLVVTVPLYLRFDPWSGR